MEFPLDNFMAGLHIVAGTQHENAGGQTRDRLRVSWLGVVEEDVGIMKASDWIERCSALGEVPREGRDLYMQSDAWLRGSIIGANYVYYFRIDKNWTLGPMLGFRY